MLRPFLSQLVVLLSVLLLTVQGKSIRPLTIRKTDTKSWNSYLPAVHVTFEKSQVSAYPFANMLHHAPVIIEESSSTGPPDTYANGTMVLYRRGGRASDERPKLWSRTEALRQRLKFRRRHVHWHLSKIMRGEADTRATPPMRRNKELSAPPSPARYASSSSTAEHPEWMRVAAYARMLTINAHNVMPCLIATHVLSYIGRNLPRFVYIGIHYCPEHKLRYLLLLLSLQITIIPSPTYCIIQRPTIHWNW